MSELAFLDRYRDIKRKFWAVKPPVAVVPLPEPKPKPRDILNVGSTLLTPRDAVRALVREIADAHGIPLNDMLSQRRSRHIVAARHELYWEIRDQTNWSLPQIGAFLDRDHTSVLHGIRAHEARKRGEKYVNPSKQKGARERWDRLLQAHGSRVPR